MSAQSFLQELEKKRKELLKEELEYLNRFGLKFGRDLPNVAGSLVSSWWTEKNKKVFFHQPSAYDPWDDTGKYYAFFLKREKDWEIIFPEDEYEEGYWLLARHKNCPVEFLLVEDGIYIVVETG